MASSLVALLLTLTASSVWAPGALDRELAVAMRDEALPLQFARDVADELAIVAHDSRAWSMAFYLAPERSIEGASGAGAPPPRLALYGPYYLRGLGLRPISDMPVDVAEYLFNALLEAHLDRVETPAGGSVGQWVAARADVVMADVPPPYRREALTDALLAFGSHVLSVAHEIERKAMQRRAAGSTLCGALQREIGLFALWRGMFERGAYNGVYVVPDPQGRGPGTAYRSAGELQRKDKQRLVELLFDDRWSGDPMTDFGGRLCPVP